MDTILVPRGQPRAAGHLFRAVSLNLTCTTNRKKNAKQNQGISKYAFGGTKYLPKVGTLGFLPKRGRNQVSSCIQDEPALKT